jgi:hypothetical protein
MINNIKNCGALHITANTTPLPLVAPPFGEISCAALRKLLLLAKIVRYLAHYDVNRILTYRNSNKDCRSI